MKLKFDTENKFTWIDLLLMESAVGCLLFVISVSFWFHFSLSLSCTPSLSLSLSVTLLHAVSTPWPHGAPGSPLNLHISKALCRRRCNDCRNAAYLFICFQVDSPRFTSLIFSSICSSQDLLPSICDSTVSVTQPGAHLNCKSCCCES